MTKNIIASNIQRLRKAKGFSQKCLAEKSGLSITAHRNIETGKFEPSGRDLRAIAKALDVSIQKLVESVEVPRAVRFRSKKKMRDREQILVDVGRWLGDFSGIEDILDDRLEHEIDNIRNRLKANENRGVAAAALTRDAFGLDAGEPINGIRCLLESGGVKVGEWRVASHDFFGLSVAASDGGPAVIVNTWEGIPVERWIFTAAHELGHLILHLTDYGVDQIHEEKPQEDEANAFAAEFLMPNASFCEAWKKTQGLAFIDRVLKVKRIFGVSYRAVLHRLADDYRDSGNIWSLFSVDYKRRTGQALLRDDEPDALARDAFMAGLGDLWFPDGGYTDKPDGLSPADFTRDRLSGLVRKAIEQEKISLGRGAEVLGLSLRDMRGLTASWIG